jgi:hypothetical protein
MKLIGSSVWLKCWPRLTTIRGTTNTVHQERDDHRFSPQLKRMPTTRRHTDPPTYDTRMPPSTTMDSNHWSPDHAPPEYESNELQGVVGYQNHGYCMYVCMHVQKEREIERELTYPQYLSFITKLFL